jgi:hypothetical protein
MVTLMGKLHLMNRWTQTRITIENPVIYSESDSKSDRHAAIRAYLVDRLGFSWSDWQWDYNNSGLVVAHSNMVKDTDKDTATQRS